jgi:quinol-cytochrome oxidoreductase complex cytochrome b subunit
MMQKNQRTWVLAIGILLIAIACVLAYLGTTPTEANL